MSVSPKVIICTDDELKASLAVEYARGVARGKFELGQSLTLARDDRQKKVYEWCLAAFGTDHVSVAQRAVRFLEEAIELAQACGARQEMVERLVRHIYAQPQGTVVQELGGVGLTLLALAQSAGMSAELAEVTELNRVLAAPLEHFAARNRNKDELGFKV